MSLTGSRTALLGTLAVAALMVSGCGDKTSDTAVDDPTTTAPPTSSAPPTSPTAPVSTTAPTVSTTPAVPAPDCAGIWVDGKTLPQTFKGCLDNGKKPQIYRFPCEFGKPLIAYDNHFYAVPGGTIHQTKLTLAKDPGYQKSLRSCGG